MKKLFDLIHTYLYQGTFGMGLCYLLDVVIIQILYSGVNTNMNNILGGLLCAVTIMGIATLGMYKTNVSQYSLKKNLLAGWIGFLAGAMLIGADGWIGVALLIAVDYVMDKAIPKKGDVKK